MSKEIEALKEERDELAAHSERLATALQKVLDEAVDDYYQIHDFDGVLANAKAALEAKPFDSLAHVRAEAIEDARHHIMDGLSVRMVDTEEFIDFIQRILKQN